LVWDHPSRILGYPHKQPPEDKHDQSQSHSGSQIGLPVRIFIELEQIRRPDGLKGSIVSRALVDEIRGSHTVISVAGRKARPNIAMAFITPLSL
jgi:hypothetical protein